jgi:hypothetical protein
LSTTRWYEEAAGGSWYVDDGSHYKLVRKRVLKLGELFYALEPRFTVDHEDRGVDGT